MLIKSCFLFLYGSCLASFACCFAKRYATNTSILNPPSYCDNCHHRLTFWQLIPILGYLLQRGHCHFCHAKISKLSTFWELFCGLTIAFLGNQLAYIHWPLLLALFFWCLCLSLQDYYTQTVASELLYFGGCFILLCGIKYCYFSLQTQWSLLLILIVLLGSLSYLGKLGSADVFFILIIACLLGFFYTIYLLLLACILAVCYCFWQHKHQIAFIPFLSSALLLLLFYLRFS